MGQPSIYSPEPTDPSSLPPGLRKVWDKAFAEARKFHAEEGPAMQTAWRYLIATTFPNGKGRKPVPAEGSVDYFEPPDDAIALGRALEITYITNTGFRDVKFTRKPLPLAVWSDEHRDLWVFPRGMFNTRAGGGKGHIDSDVYHTWSKRDPKDSFDAKVEPEYAMYLMGIGDSFSYRSDKWGNRNPDPDLVGSQEYYHMHTGGGVRVWANDPKRPTVWRIHGGMLDLHAKGLIH